MKTTIFTLLFSIIAGASFAQSMAGVTGIPDTSFNNESAYRYALKENPEITLVQEFAYKDVKSKKNITYCNFGGRALQADVFYPGKQPKKKRIAVIMVHGGGWRSGNRTQHYPLAQRLAHLGYVCVTPEYRLSTEALYPAGVYDLKAAIRWTKSVAKEYGIDTNRVVITGFSAGGELAAFLGTTGGKPEFEGDECLKGNSSIVQAVVDIDGTLSFTHPETGEGNDAKGTSAGTYWFGYPRKDNFELWEQASPLAHVSANTPPTLFINSKLDRMHAGRTDYIKALDSYGIYTEIKPFDEAPHCFCLFNPWFEPTVTTIDQFLKKVFK